VSLRSTSLVFLILLIAAPASARPFRVSDIPNGSKKGCLNCHIDEKASAFTDFGSDAQAKLVGSGTVTQRHVDWAPLCPIDSDYDGWSNGVELGDPDCVWKAGDPNPSGPVFNPGDQDSHPPPICGNGKLDAGEPCEGAMFSSTTCADEGAGEGALGCTAQCQFDFSECTEPPDAPPPVDEMPDVSEEGCSAAGGRGASSGPSGALIPALILGLAIARAAARRGARSR
jgi:hypothetical protein